MLYGPAGGTNDLIALPPTQFPEQIESLLVTEFEDFPHGQGAGLG